MPRPSVKKERTEEILQAFERCVARYGVEGSTLERLAEESGLQRSLIRHYMGNRDDLIKALLQRFLEESDRQLVQLFSALPGDDRATTMVEYLFDNSYSDQQYALVANALFSAAANNHYLAKPLKKSIDDFINAIDELLASTHPKSPAQQRYAVANGIVGIYFNIESISQLGDSGQWRQASEQSAQLLINSLDQK